MIEYKQIIADYTHHNKLLNKIKFYDFMNHGYDPVSNLLDKDFIMKREASLYFKLLENIDTNNKNILDVGCGRGGGVALYKKYFNFQKCIWL